MFLKSVFLYFKIELSFVKTKLILSFNGLNFNGILNHVLRPINTTFGVSLILLLVMDLK